MFLDTFMQLCNQRGVSANKACIDIGLSRTAVSKWKSGGKPNGTSVAKIAEYFNVSIDYLLGKDNEKNPPSKELDRQLKGVEFALFGEVHELTDAEKEDVLAFIKFKKSLRKD